MKTCESADFIGMWSLIRAYPFWALRSAATTSRPELVTLFVIASGIFALRIRVGSRIGELFTMVAKHL